MTLIVKMRKAAKKIRKIRILRTRPSCSRIRKFNKMMDRNRLLRLSKSLRRHRLVCKISRPMMLHYRICTNFRRLLPTEKRQPKLSKKNKINF